MYNYPCTGIISADNFPDFLKKELGSPRRNIQLFAQTLKELFGVKYLSLVNSGSSANLISALIVKELRPDKKKILMSGFSFPTTISSFKNLGFEVELIDIQNNGFNISTPLLESKINDKIAAVVVTHFLGFSADIENIKKLCNKHNVLIVQDACETMNLKVNNNSIHSFGDIVTHSFYHPHHLSSYGGGAISVNKLEYYSVMESFVHWGRACTCHYNQDLCEAPDGINHNFWYKRSGINVEISELNACFGRFQINSWEEQEALRKKRYEQMYQRFKKHKFLQLFPSNQNISPFVFPIKVPTDKFNIITNEILNHSIEIRTLMGGAIHKHPGFIELNNGNLLNTEEMGKSSFFCGIHQSIEEQKFNDMLIILDQIFYKYEA